MPIKFTADHICEKCGKDFEWNYFELKRQNIDSPEFEPENLPFMKNLVHSCKEKSNHNYEIGVNCPYCKFDNRFTYDFRKLK